MADSKLEALLSVEEKKVLVKVKNICPLQEELQEISVPKEKREARYEAYVAAGREQGVTEMVLELSDTKTKVIDYIASFEPDDDEAAKLVKNLEITQLIRLATGDPAKGQGSNLGAAGISVPGSAGETSLAALEHGIFAEDYVGEGTPYYQYCTAIPVGTLLAQTWDEIIIEEVGAMIAEEMVRFGVTLWLADPRNSIQNCGHTKDFCGYSYRGYSVMQNLKSKVI